nr:MAG TPA: hypothetical protein [Caudoviricetes sp.]
MTKSYKRKRKRFSRRRGLNEKGEKMKTLKQILTCKEILEDEEAQGIIDEIIGLLRSKHITYACAYNILNGVMDALTEFSRQLPM